MGWQDATSLGNGQAGQNLLNYGAPYRVRAIVDAVRPRDRLATLRQYYPDAEPIGDDNFIYTDESGGKTLYNKRGLEPGDIAGSGRLAAETVGGIAGAGLAAPSGPVGMAAGGAMGAMAADQLVDLALRAYGVPYSATPVEQLVTDPAQDLTLAGISEMGGQALGALPDFLRRLIARPEAPQIATAAQNIGVEPTVGMLGGPGTSAFENTFARALPGSAAARGQARAGAQTAQAATSMLPGQPMTVMEGKATAGRALKEGAERSYDAFRAYRQRLDDRVYAEFGQGATVPVDELRQVGLDLMARIGEAPNSLGPILDPVLERIRSTVNDAAQYGGQLPLQVQRNLRTVLGQELKTEATTKLTPEAQRWLKTAYDAMTDDLRVAARAQSPEAFRSLDRHDRLVRGFRRGTQGRESIAESLDKILKSNSDEAAYAALMAPSGGLNRMRQVLDRLNTSEQRVVARAAWDQMLTTRNGNFNLNYLLGQWQKANPEVRRELFGRVGDLDRIEDLMTVIGSLRDADRTRNFSNTAYTLLQAEFGERAVSELATKISGAVTGGGLGYAGIIPTETLGVPAAAYLMSEVIHSPRAAREIVRALNGQPIQRTESFKRLLGRVMARLSGQGPVDEPEDEDETTQPPVLPNGVPMVSGGWRGASSVR